MERVSRKSLQGVTNIIRFNWHYYALAIMLIPVILFSSRYLPDPLNTITFFFFVLVTAGMILSLLISWYVYDCSSLYSLNWLNTKPPDVIQNLVNINAGFDELSGILQEKYPKAGLRVFDFYNPEKHTEISIERARKAYAPFPGTKTISTRAVPLEPGSADIVFLILAAHEIRNDEERIIFFKQLGNSLNKEGRIILVEHLRDLPNFIAYNFGFFHFLSPATWRRTIQNAGLIQLSETKITPFISVFTLAKNGTTP